MGKRRVCVNNKIDGTKQNKSEEKNIKIKSAAKSFLQNITCYPYLWARRLLIIFILVPTVIFLLYCIGDHGFILIDTSLTVGDALSFYGTLLSFIGTVALGILALYQNIQANKINHRLLLLEEKEKVSFLIPVEELIIEFYKEPDSDYRISHTFMANLVFTLKNYFETIVHTFQITPRFLTLQSNDYFYHWEKVGFIFGISPKKIYYPSSKKFDAYFSLSVPSDPKFNPTNLDSFDACLQYSFTSTSIYNDVYEGSCIIHANVHRDPNNQLRYNGNIIIDSLSYQSSSSPPA